MLRMLAVVAVSLFAGEAMAQGLAKDIHSFRHIEVNFSEHAHVCSLKEAKPFKHVLHKHLIGMGVERDPKSHVEVSLNVTAAAGGLLDQHCVANIELMFFTMLAAKEVDVTATVVGRELIMEKITKLETLPIVYYKSGLLLSTPEQEAVQRVSQATESLIEKFKEHRQ